MKKPRRGKVLSTQLLSGCVVSKTKRLQSRALSSADKAFLRHQRGPCTQNLPGSSPLHIETYEGRGTGHHSTYTPRPCPQPSECLSSRPEAVFSVMGLDAF